MMAEEEKNEETAEETEEETDQPSDEASAEEEDLESADDVEEAEENEEEETEADEDSDELEDLESSMTSGEEEEAEAGEADEDEESEPTKPIVKSDGEYYGTGRRKESVARVWIEAGNGTIKVNERDVEAYFNNRASWVQAIMKPLDILGFEEDIDVWATLDGGGLTGQADALKLGIARALVEMDENARSFLKPDGMLTRDDRQVERKKINQPGARAKQQVSKR